MYVNFVLYCSIELFYLILSLIKFFNFLMFCGKDFSLLLWI